MDTFIGRKQELEALQKRWHSRRSEFVILYGRRRVGKTELIRQFAKNKRVLFSVGTRSDSRSQIKHFLAVLAGLTRDPGLARLPIDNWETVFERLDRTVNNFSGKTLVVFDEFQWLVNAAPQIPSLLQKWWDHSWSKSNKIFLILCGSYLGFMEREVLGHKSPLFGRKTGLISLKPLSFREALQFDKKLTLKDQMKIYLVCGGIPAYHKMFSSHSSLADQLVSLFFSIDAPLAKEADFLLMEELRDPKIYFSLLENLGTFRKTLSELSRLIGVERSNLPYYTKNLMDLRYVEKVEPLLRFKSPHTRKVTYRICDPLLRFWFTFVYPNQSILQSTAPKTFFSTAIGPHLDAYWGKAFEQAAAELFIVKKVAPKISEPFKHGSYWDKNIQIDFTVVTKSNFVYLGEIKWNKLTPTVVSNFLEKVKVFEDKVSYQPVMLTLEPLPANVRKIKGVDIYSIKELI